MVGVSFARLSKLRIVPGPSKVEKPALMPIEELRMQTQAA